jgi:DNA-directed RNA polymerase specialized sigma24 family protein
MKEHQNAVRQEDFDALLGLFSHDRDEAGHQYERLRAGLVRFFDFRGCADAEALADETLNRVALKAGGFETTKNVKLTSYVYGFASNVYREYSRGPRSRELALEADDFIDRLRAPEPGPDREPMFACLSSCLHRLNDADRELVMEYYSREKQEKIATRKRLAERMGCRVEVLHTRVFRLKASLRKCVSGCVADN